MRAESEEKQLPQGEDIWKVAHLVGRRMIAMTTIHFGSDYARSPGFNLLLWGEEPVCMCMLCIGEGDGVRSLEFNSP